MLPPPSSSFWRATTLQQPSNLRGLVKSGQRLFGVVLSYPSVHVAKTLAATGADWCWIGTEHVPWSPTLLVEAIQVIIHESGGKMIPVVRVPSKSAYDYIAWCLDAGAGGIIVPHVETAEEVAAVAAACRYPPLGHRSFSPFIIPGVTDKTPPGESIYSIANKHIAIIPQIESVRGIDNLDAIISSPQVDAVMFGSADLRLDMGLPAAFTGAEPEYTAALARMLSLAARHNIPLACLALGESMTKMRLAQGFSLLFVSGDLRTLSYGTMGELRKARDLGMAADGTVKSRL
ncbi:Pyruvate/Phosphoenolpyruvate kinase-like domain-containing protein [Mycena alexandri]|uniref:Pyruvate/Phosphoenolpyruvate kinase-like domain-containing protein n=1 Tax=Mycena alexandri TaxID=1745969 RepID=A0AAD6T2Y9_9AGAR|nr:Pyruvate/Phosphoenolpyruvate kinase-like domain-containing protein [Mycena alexandri]